MVALNSRESMSHGQAVRTFLFSTDSINTAAAPSVAIDEITGSHIGFVAAVTET